MYAPVCPYIGIGAVCFRHGHRSALCARCRAHTLVTTPSAVPEPSALKRGRAREVQLSEIQCHDHCPGPSRDNVIVIVTIVLQIPNHRVTCGWPRARRPWKRSRSSWHVLSAPCTHAPCNSPKYARLPLIFILAVVYIDFLVVVVHCVRGKHCCHRNLLQPYTVTTCAGL